jgi:glycerate kinase
VETLERDAGVSRTLAELPGAGAAGGSGYALAVLGAALIPGASLVADAIGLDAAMVGSALVITGEGRLDLQTAEGKAPMEVAWRAARQGILCAAVAGSVVAVPEGFAEALSLDSLASADVDPVAQPAALLRLAGALLTHRLAGVDIR